tara:strand:- start:423 stop:1040 length:618 start_codon:yes stop_codon:yes gene_type:complete
VTDFSIEKKFIGPVIGLDEVGRGPLAGPVISCGCLFKKYIKLDHKIKDSKKLTKIQRLKLFQYFCKLKNEKILDFHLGIASVEEIDKLNILEATKLSMKRVIDKFNILNPNIIIDGNFLLNYNNVIEKSVINGDQLSISIATASIIAKVHRDRLMSILSKKFDKFSWQTNAGYGTKKHIEEIKKNGPSLYHRKTFEPIKSLLLKD